MNAPLRSVLDVLDMRTKRRERAVRALLAVLELDDDHWADLPAILARNLSEEELCRLGHAVLRALPDEIALETAAGAINVSPLMMNPLGDEAWESALAWARTWAREAAVRDLKAYATASIERMPPSTVAGFCQWLVTRAKP